MTAITMNAAGSKATKAKAEARKPGLFWRLLSLVVQYDAFHSEYDRLKRKSDRDLADIGLSRGDLVQLAWKGGEERRAAWLARR